MTYIIKRKFQGALGDDVDSSGMSSLVQHIQENTGTGLPTSLDNLTVNNLVVLKTLKIPARTDGYK